MENTLLETNIEALITPAVESQGYSIVRVKLREKENRTLEIMAERQNDHALNLDDCERISHLISAIMDVEDPIAGEYILEVTSPGLDRPLVKSQDYITFADKEAKIVTKHAINGQKKFKGKLKGLSNDQVVFIHQNQELMIPLNDIDSANLLIDDSIINECMN